MDYKTNHINPKLCIFVRTFRKVIMKKVLLFILFSMVMTGLKAQSISHIETTKNWYYIYDQDGKKIKTLSTSQGELKGYSSERKL